MRSYALSDALNLSVAPLVTYPCVWDLVDPVLTICPLLLRMYGNTSVGVPLLLRLIFIRFMKSFQRDSGVCIMRYAESPACASYSASGTTSRAGLPSARTLPLLLDVADAVNGSGVV